MLFEDSLRQLTLCTTKVLRTCVTPFAMAGALLSPASTWAQATGTASNPAAPLAKAATSAPATPIVLTTPSFAPSWSALSPAQQQSLRPLSETWNTLSDGHRRKWIALAKNYPTLSPDGQTKLHSRMAEWAALSPRERELARLNFAATKKLPTPDRASDWEAYKALSPEYRQKLARKARSRSTGAAPAIKPVPLDKLAALPATRRTPQLIREMEIAQQSIDRFTLLPLRPRAPQDAPKPLN